MKNSEKTMDKIVALCLLQLFFDVRRGGMCRLRHQIRLGIDGIIIDHRGDDADQYSKADDDDHHKGGDIFGKYAFEHNRPRFCKIAAFSAARLNSAAQTYSRRPRPS